MKLRIKIDHPMKYPRNRRYLKAYYVWCLAHKCDPELRRDFKRITKHLDSLILREVVSKFEPLRLAVNTNGSLMIFLQMSQTFTSCVLKHPREVHKELQRLQNSAAKNHYYRPATIKNATT